MSGNQTGTSRVALVTGASRGIGEQTALALARDGVDIAIAYGGNSEAAQGVRAEVEALGRRAITIAADLRTASKADQLVATTLERLGRIDIVVNNAGITRDNLTMRLKDSDWDDVLAVNLTAAFHICREVIRPMLKQRSGRIINVASVSGVVGNAGQANYSATKAGLIGLTKALAREVGSRGITVNAVAPGFIDTDMTADLGPKVLDAVVKNIPLGRTGTAVEVADAIAFLASPRAAYITGHVLHIDGGLAA